MAIVPYDVQKVFVTFGGVPISGFAEGSFIECSKDEDSILKQVGSDGEVARAINRNEGGKVKLTLQQHSLSNDFLSLRRELDRQGAGSGDLMIRDVNGTTLVHAEEAWILKPADVGFAKESGSREWTFDTGRLDMFVGGRQ